MTDPRVVAHVRMDQDGAWSAPHLLDDHLSRTANLAEAFAATFGSGPWGQVCGLGHDTGKATSAWQRYLRSKSGYDEDAHLESNAGKLDHSSPAARLAEEVLGARTGRILSYCIAGHHAGLPDWIGSRRSLLNRLHQNESRDIPSDYAERLAKSGPLVPPWQFDRRSLDMSLWIRMLFSCLVDADFLDTEAYMQVGRAELRGNYLAPSSLLERFNTHVTELAASAMRAAASPVNRARQRVLADCRVAAWLEPGFFSLTVPTGGGKTLSSMAFALEHAVHHGRSRVIYVIPYTSIIEQNADVFRVAVGSDQVVEHHSNLDEDGCTPRSRIAAENWDAPVIVTTSVQFFESLFAAKPSRCRKLHNIANSVVVLDEAQLLPVELLQPILQTMRLLVDHYRVTFVICTATQPALEARDGFAGLPNGSVREIVRDVPALYRELRRVEVMPVDTKTPRSWQEIADELAASERVLCVVSDRRSCRELHRLMPKGTYHLSALMCPQHRTDLIHEIKQKLKEHGSVRVISTQLVEAGVDIDFPVVYRALAGLDSIAQAAGRCNREGRLADEGRLGRVVVFVPPRKAPAGILRKAAETATRLLDAGLADPIGHAAFRPYFSEIYWKANDLDKVGILRLLVPDAADLGIQFRCAAEAFKIVDDARLRTVLVPYREGEELIAELRNRGPERHLLRRLQRYGVNVYVNQFTDLDNRGSLEEPTPGIFAVTCPVEYDETVGLLLDEMPDEDKFIC